MHGDCVQWIPGTDHAGIATQAVVERKLLRERGITRHSMSREAFVGEIWQWKQQYGGTITSQLRTLGASLDWEREVFTLDDAYSNAVSEAFVRLHESGLLYRATRLVNWSCHLRTALSDIEVDEVAVEGPTDMRVPGPAKMVSVGEMHAIAYRVADSVPVDGSEQELVVMTTRPETAFGDVAVCVHPGDADRARFVGHHVINPVNGRRIPVIADAEFVTLGLGSGAVKVCVCKGVCACVHVCVCACVCVCV
eukprot:Opistho-2@80530